MLHLVSGELSMGQILVSDNVQNMGCGLHQAYIHKSDSNHFLKRGEMRTQGQSLPSDPKKPQAGLRHPN